MTDLFDLDFSYAYGKPETEAQFRLQPEDFYVAELLGFPLSGTGEHEILLITKTGQNTHWVAKELAEKAGVQPMSVGYCGRKDRHAVCRQYFSVQLPGKQAPNWHLFNIDGVEIEPLGRHLRKLRLGDHSANNFRIVLRNIANMPAFQSRLEQIKQGVPNYFGEQRFGINGNNVSEGDRWAKGELKLRDKKKRGIYMSALRSVLFNKVLSVQIDQGIWHASFASDSLTGPLWGRGRNPAEGEMLRLENDVVEPYADWRQLLEHCGLKQERRPSVSKPNNLACVIENNNATLSFGLSAGQFATSVLRELTQLDNAASAHWQS